MMPEIIEHFNFIGDSYPNIFRLNIGRVFYGKNWIRVISNKFLGMIGGDKSQGQSGASPFPLEFKRQLLTFAEFPARKYWRWKNVFCLTSTSVLLEQKIIVWRSSREIQFYGHVAVLGVNFYAQEES
jgi:hypothetical protein